MSNRVIVLGAKPGRIKEIIEVPFPSERPELPELRGDPRFQDIRRRMWELIREQPAATVAAA